MERKETFEFSDEELQTLERALAMYAAYTLEMEVKMLVGDESDGDKVSANHNRALKMHKQLFNLTHPTDYENERRDFAERRGRPMDPSDFSDFDWFKFVSEHSGRNTKRDDDYNEYRVNYFEEGERIEKTIKGSNLRTTGGGFGMEKETYIIERDGDIVWSHGLTSTNTVELIE